MNDSFRTRFFTPFLLPLGVLGAIALFGFSLSRILMAIPQMGATIIALLLAGYVLLVAGIVAGRRHITARTLSVSLGVGLAAVIGAGAVATAVGPREITPPTEEGEEEEVAEDEEAEDEEAEDADIPDDAAVWVAVDNEFTESPDSIPADEATAALDNEGNAFHNVVLEEAGDEEILAADGGEVDVQDVQLEAGEYYYYCDVPGHEETMNGTVPVE